MVALALGAALLWCGSRLTWTVEESLSPLPGSTPDTRTGAEQVGSLVPMAVLALAGIAGMVATRGWPRRLFGAVLVCVGAAACVVAVTGTLSGGIRFAHGLVLVGGLLVACGGVVGLSYASRLPSMGGRYAAPGQRRVTRDPETELWESLSEGEDPTTRG